MKTVIIVQARMTSTRLPGKVLKTVLGKPLLEYLFERLRRVRLADAFVIATTVNETDEPIVDLCRQHDVPVTRGSEEDVLARYYEAACAHAADVVVRVTSDCPLIDPAIIDEAIAMYRTGQYDYVSNTLQLSYPYGMAVEVLAFRELEQAWREAVDPAEREHVTPFIYRHPERFRIGHLRYKTDLSSHRWTVDTAEDFTLVRKLLEEVYPRAPEFDMDDLLVAISQHPDWPLINAAIKQKTLDDQGTK
ncbi:MAG: cytidylyltransferase domain-containing protein [Telluria sp.]